LAVLSAKMISNPSTPRDHAIRVKPTGPGLELGIYLRALCGQRAWYLPVAQG